jgi:hypothetical protein
MPHHDKNRHLSVVSHSACLHLHHVLGAGFPRSFSRGFRLCVRRQQATTKQTTKKDAGNNKRKKPVPSSAGGEQGKKGAADAADANYASDDDNAMGNDSPILTLYLKNRNKKGRALDYDQESQPPEWEEEEQHQETQDFPSYSSSMTTVVNEASSSSATHNKVQFSPAPSL